MVVSDLEGQRRLLVDVVGLQVMLEEGEYVRIGGQGGFYIGLEEGVHGSPCDDLEINIQVDDVEEVHRRLVEAGILVEAPPRTRSGAAGMPGSETSTGAACPCSAEAYRLRP
jgi:hypothetical protein